MKEQIVLSLFNGMNTLRQAMENVGIPVKKYYSSEIKPYAIKLTQHHFPDTIQLGDITKWREWNIDWSEITFIGSGSPCFVSGTKVICENAYKNIEDVMVGDSVLTHKNRFKKVLRVGCSFKDTLIIKAQGVKDVETTNDHPFYVRTCKKVYRRGVSNRDFSDPYWKSAIDLQKGDYVGLPILKSYSNKYNLTNEEAWIIGRYIADGHTRKDFKKRGNNDNRNWQLILSVGKSKLNDFNFIKEYHYSNYEHSQSVNRVVFSSKRLVEIVEENCGNGAMNKKISMELINLPVDILKSLLDGYMSGDGCFTNNKFKASSISSELIMNLNLIIAKVYKVNSSFDFTEKPKKHIIDCRIVNQNNTYTTSFNKEIKKQSHAVVIDDIIWLPFKDKIETNKKNRVYNLEVEDDNSYTANNVIVHNCQDLSIAGKRAGIKGNKSSLFFTFIEILNHVKKLNPNVIFLQENVGSANIIDIGIMSRELGVYPVRINSNLVVAQNRDRYYWSNIRTKQYGMFGDLVTDIPQPKDRNVYLKDIIESGKVDKEKATAILESQSRCVVNQKSLKQRADKDFITVVKEVIQLNSSTESGETQPYQQNRVYDINGLFPAICTTNNGFIKTEEYFRKLTQTELERLQGFPDGYTSILSYGQSSSLLGDGWTLPVIEWIISFLPNNFYI